MTMEEINNLAKAVLLSGMPIAHKDEHAMAVREFVNGTLRILDAHRGRLGSAAKRLISDGNVRAFSAALIPVFLRIRYEAYSPYWLLHCRQVTMPDQGKVTYYNDLIDKYWAGDYGVWQGKNGNGITLMLPPTKGMLSLKYREELDAYAAQSSAL